MEESIVLAVDIGKKAGLIKAAVIGWGGGQYYLGPKDYGLGLEAGYTNALGLLPIPKLGLVAGNKNFSLSAGLPYIGIRAGLPLQGWHRNLPRSLWELIYDKAVGNPDPYEMRAAEEEAIHTEVMDQLYPGFNDLSISQKIQLLSKYPAIYEHGFSKEEFDAANDNFKKDLAKLLNKNKSNKKG